MKVLKVVAIGILDFVGIVILATVIALATLFGYFSFQLFLFGRGDYLLFVSKELNMIPALMIMGLIIYAFAMLKEKLFSKKEKLIEHIDEIDKDNEIMHDKDFTKSEKFILKVLGWLIAFDDIILKVWKVIKILYLSVLIVSIYLGMTSYAILYTDRVKLSSPGVPKGVIYKYSDIKNVNVGINKGYKNSYSPYYMVVFNDGKSVDFFGGTMNEDKGIDFEYILIDLDKKLRISGVPKSVNKESFEKYSKGLDKDFVSRVEKLFDDR